VPVSSGSMWVHAPLSRCIQQKYLCNYHLVDKTLFLSFDYLGGTSFIAALFLSD
jgi:hypothetical protein